MLLLVTSRSLTQASYLVRLEADPALTQQILRNGVGATVLFLIQWTHSVYYTESSLMSCLYLSCFTLCQLLQFFILADC